MSHGSHRWRLNRLRSCTSCFTVDRLAEALLQLSEVICGNFGMEINWAKHKDKDHFGFPIWPVTVNSCGGWCISLLWQPNLTNSSRVRISPFGICKQSHDQEDNSQRFFSWITSIPGEDHRRALWPQQTSPKRISQILNFDLHTAWRKGHSLPWQPKVAMTYANCLTINDEITSKTHMTKTRPPWDDGNFVNRDGILCVVSDQSMPSLMICCQ